MSSPMRRGLTQGIICDTIHKYCVVEMSSPMRRGLTLLVSNPTTIIANSRNEFPDEKGIDTLDIRF